MHLRRSAFAASRLRRDSLRWLAEPKLACTQSGKPAKAGADDRDRTGDLVLTKDVLCQLSYIGIDGLAPTRGPLERETGIEPATNSLEGCDSTIELLPQSLLASPLPSFTTPAGPTRAADGGEGRIRTFEATRATDLQSAAFDRSATSPSARAGSGLGDRDGGRTCRGWTSFPFWRPVRAGPIWSWRRDSNPRPADYKSAALPG